MYKLSYYRFGEGSLMATGRMGFDRVRQACPHTQSLRPEVQPCLPRCLNSMRASCYWRQACLHPKPDSDSHINGQDAAACSRCLVVAMIGAGLWRRGNLLRKTLCLQLRSRNSESVCQSQAADQPVGAVLCSITDSLHACCNLGISPSMEVKEVRANRGDPRPGDMP